MKLTQTKRFFLLLTVVSVLITGIGYSQTNFSWDPGVTGTGSTGGAGTWDTSSNSWWDGTSQSNWPSSSSGQDVATFAGTGGIVTIDSGVTASTLIFNSAGYTLTGGSLTFDGSSILRSTGVITNIESQLIGSAPVSLEGVGGGLVLRGDNSGLTVPVTMAVDNLGISQDSALGSGVFTAGAGGSVLINALNGNRTIANNVNFAGSQLTIDTSAMGTGLTVGDLTINGNLALNGVSPAELVLRKALTINGVVSGSNNNNGLTFATNGGTLTLTGDNTFTNNITWKTSSILAADSDAALGDAANSLTFISGIGSLRMQAAFNSARPIVIDNKGTGTAGTSTTEGRINTNGFDSTWTGTISAPVFSAPAVAQQLTAFTKFGNGTLTLDPGVGTINNLRSGGIRAEGGTLKINSGTFLTGSGFLNGGVNGSCFLEINGGSLTSGNFAVGKSTSGVVGTFTLNGGTYTNTSQLAIGFNSSGIITINGGLADLSQFGMVEKVNLTSTMNLNGGEVRLNLFNARLTGTAPATARINFNGSLIRAKSTQTDFIATNSATAITANVQAGGAIFNTRNAADTTSYDITIKQPLLHDPALGATLDGGLTKNGLGTLTLAPIAGPNTYTGPTTVNAGVLALNGMAIDDTGKLDIVGGIVFIPAATNEVVDTLFYNGVQQPAGIYGSTASGAEDQNNTYFDVAGSGTLTVNSGPIGGSDFTSWLAANSPATGFTTDSDNDGLANGVENVLGTNPNTSSAGLNQVSTAANSVTFKHTLNPTIASDVNYSYEWSSDLIEWRPSGVANTAGTIGTIVPSAPVSGVVSVTTTQTGTPSSRLFTRIKATKPVVLPAAVMEAETAQILQGGDIKNLVSASGGTYVDGSEGCRIKWTFNSATGGAANIILRTKVPSGERYMDLYLNGVLLDGFVDDSTAWGEQGSIGMLQVGLNTVELIDTLETAEFDVDYLDVRPVFEAESAIVNNGAVINSSAASRGQYIDGGPGAIYRWDFSDPSGGAVNLDLRIKSPSGTRSMGVYVNDVKVGVLHSIANQWEVRSVRATLNAGANKVEFIDSEGTAELDVDYLSVNDNIEGFPCVHLLVCCRSANDGTKFLVNGSFTENHDYRIIDHTRSILQSIKDAGIDTVIVDLTNPAQWETLINTHTIPQINNIAQVCREKKMQWFIHYGGQVTDISRMDHNIPASVTRLAYWNGKAKIIWDNWAQTSEYRKYEFGGNSDPITVIFDNAVAHNAAYASALPSEKDYVSRFRRGTVEINTGFTQYDVLDGWGYRNRFQSSAGNVRFVSPNPGNPPSTWGKISQTAFRREVIWARRAGDYSIYGSYDDTPDSIFWGIADTVNSQKPHHVFPDPTNPFYYHDVVRSLLTK